MSKFKKGQISWNKGLSKEECEKHYPNGFKGGAEIGHYVSEKTKNKISISNRGNQNGLGKLKSFEEIKKLSETRKRLFKEGKIVPSSSCFKKGHAPLYRPPNGEKHWFYNGGTREKGITNTEWNKLQKSVLERNGYICQICGIGLKVIIRNDGLKTPNLHIHHLDSDKKNNSLDNLTTLCIACHTKTHINRIINLKNAFAKDVRMITNMEGVELNYDQ